MMLAPFSMTQISSLSSVVVLNVKLREISPARVATGISLKGKERAEEALPPPLPVRLNLSDPSEALPLQVALRVTPVKIFVRMASAIRIRRALGGIRRYACFGKIRRKIAMQARIACFCILILRQELKRFVPKPRPPQALA